MADTPKIRFKGFTDAWEQCKFEDLCDMVTVGIANSATQAYTECGVVMFRNQNIKPNFLDDDDIIFIDSEFETKYKNKRLKKNDLLIARTGYPGTACVVPEKYENAQTFTTLIARPKSSVNPFFLCQYLNSDIGVKYFESTQIGGGQKNSGAGILNQMPIALPLVIEEETKIAKYLGHLDNLIILHQRKCDKTKEIKKYMLQKMFPQNGKKNPEIRFAGFTDDWEQRKFSEFTFPAGEKNKNDLQLETYAITNEHGFIPQNEAHDDFGYMKNTDRTAYNIVTSNSFAYNPARINVGSIGYYKGQENVIVSSLYEVFQTKEYVDDEFLWQWFRADEFPRWIERLQEGSVRQYFYYDKLCECELKMPEVEEQRQIAAYFSNLDNLINLHQRKCDELKEVKKFMLQNMFPQKG